MTATETGAAEMRPTAAEMYTAAAATTTKVSATATEMHASATATEMHPSATAATATSEVATATAATATSEVATAAATSSVAARSGLRGQWHREDHYRRQQDCANSDSIICHGVPPGHHVN